LILLSGFSLGVGVMIVLLSVGQAMLEQSRDVSLVGGGEVTVLPQGIDVEAMRTGGISGMFFGIDRARFVTRQVLGGPRHREIVRAVSPMIEGKLVYLRQGEQVVPVRAGGEIPSRAEALGSELHVLSGTWRDSPSDSLYIAPTRQQLYDELDRFHLPETPDSTWAEWHYFNVVIAPDEWWYITFMVGGELTRNQFVAGLDSAVGQQQRRWGGQILISRRRPDGRYERYVTRKPAGSIVLDTSRADLALGESHVRQRNGRYEIHASAKGAAGTVAINIQVTPASNRYFPPVELRDDDFVSGYVVPALVASASGRICLRDRCQRFADVTAYHDHNWGVWRDVTWEWGAARGNRLALLYGGVFGPQRTASTDASSVRSPFFLAAVDSLGVAQVMRFGQINYTGTRPLPGSMRSPREFQLVATRERDTLVLEVRVEDAQGTTMQTSAGRRDFIQMRGRFTLSGRLLGQLVADTGQGFFETYVVPP
jgi:hypothetical protein